MTRLLALIPGGIGTQLQCFPMLESLQSQYPQAQIDVVVEPRAKAAYRISPVVKQVLAFDFRGRTGPADWGNLIGWVREREYDAVISLDQSRFNGLLLWLTGIQKRVGLAESGGAMFMSDTVQLQPKTLTAHTYCDLTLPFEGNHHCPELSIAVPPHDVKWAESERQRLGIEGDRGYLLLHGGFQSEREAAAGADDYPISSWKSLIQGIEERQPDLPIVLVQSIHDESWLVPLKTALPNLKISLPDDLGKFAAMVAGANLMVCPDCDVLLLAVALKTYLVGLFGSTDHRSVLPEDSRFIALQSASGRVKDIPPIQILEKILGQ